MLGGSWSRDTLARRLTIIILAVVTMMGLLAAAASAWTTQRVLVGSVDRTLSQAVGHPHADATSLAGDLPRDSVVLVETNGRVTVEAVGYGSQVSARAKQQLREFSNRSGWFSSKVDGYDDMRILVRHDGNRTMLAAVSLEDTERDIAKLAAFEAGAWFLAAVLAAISGVAVARRVTAPLSDVVETAESVAHAPVAAVKQALSERVPSNRRGVSEVESVKDSVNALLGQAEQALQQRDENEALMRAFLADVSHDLRTPIAVVRSHAELSRGMLTRYQGGLEEARRGLEASGDSDTAQTLTDNARRLAPYSSQLSDSLDRIESEADRMGKLVDDLLTLARLNSTAKPEVEPVDLTFLALEAMSDARVLSPDHHWKFDSASEPVEIVSDPEGVRRVLTNLVTNARRHTPAGTSVTIGVRGEDEEYVTLTVADDGPGLPGDVALDPGARFANRKRSDRGSSGLGLAIIRGLVEQMGGDVTFDSGSDGLRVTVRLPKTPRAGDERAGGSTRVD